MSSEAMTNCECPLAGYCKRHKVTKPEGWHKLCQTNKGYFQAWEQERGPGQAGRNPKQEVRRPKHPSQPTDDRKEQRRKKVAEAIRRKAWLISWLTILRSPQDAGIGDTADRLRQQRKKTNVGKVSDAHESVNRLLAQCSCSKTEAVTKLNKEYPY